MDELNEAYIDRLVSKLENNFSNISDYDKMEYVRRVKDGLSRILDESFYNIFKEGYRDMGNNYIDRDIIKEIASEYRDCVEYIHGLETEDGEGRYEVVKKLEAKLKEKSFYKVDVDDYNKDELIDNAWVNISIVIQPLKGMGIFHLSLYFENFENNIKGMDSLLPDYSFKVDIESFDENNSGDEYVRDDFGRVISIKTKDGEWEKETNLPNLSN